MTLLSLSLFFIPTLTGALIVHLLLPGKSGGFLLLKLALGIGLGLGLNSIIFFLTLLIEPAFQRIWMISGGLLFLVVVVTIVQERRKDRLGIKIPQITHLQWIMLGFTAIALVFSGLTFYNLTRARPQGAYDAWAIWNRSARFIYRDQENWKATLSPDLYWATHADYPLLIPLNVAWGWNAIGKETPRTPMVQGALFVVATLLLVFSSVYLTRTLGQASLASLVLLSTPVFISFSYGQIADSPLAFFILAATALLYLYFKFNEPKLLTLAGCMAGLAAWTKNEGLLFVLVSFPAIFLASGRREFFRMFRFYILGLLIPLAVVVFFKIALAPPSEYVTISDGNRSLLTKALDVSRYWIVAKAVVKTLLTYPGVPFSIFIQMALYAVIMRFDVSRFSQHGVRVAAIAILFQFVGYFAIYVVTPYDLVWHLNSALPRLIFHLFPTLVFLLFSTVADPESVFQDINKLPA